MTLTFCSLLEVVHEMKQPGSETLVARSRHESE